MKKFTHPDFQTQLGKLIAELEQASQIEVVVIMLSYGLGVLLGMLLPFIQRILAGKKRKQRNVEIMARALFQKGGLHHTSTKIATLIYISLLEKMVYVVADRGAQMAIPEEEWQKITTNLENIFKAKNTPEALLIELKKCKETFHRYIPALENNINELPNDLSIDL
ncbi:MAG: TPM domain-containing protein [Methylococcaceae bacterium]|nr:TPM domain-containing protein [Methylococcaceae bacterium]